MNKRTLFGIFSVCFFVFSCCFFVSRIKDCSADEDLILYTNQHYTEEKGCYSVDAEDNHSSIDFCNNELNSQANEIIESDIKNESQSSYETGNTNKTGNINNLVLQNTKTETAKKTHNQHQWELVMQRDAIPIKDGKNIYRCSVCFTGYEQAVSYSAKNKTELYIPSVCLSADVVMAECNQENTDTYDICCDTKAINEKNPLFFGHSNNSLGKLCEVKVGDIIYFTHNDEIGKYKVIVSEEGHLVDGGRNIIGNKTKSECISDMEKETLHFFTCYQTPFNVKGRWIVLAERMDIQ